MEQKCHFVDLFLNFSNYQKITFLQNLSFPIPDFPALAHRRSKKKFKFTQKYWEKIILILSFFHAISLQICM